MFALLLLGTWIVELNCIRVGTIANGRIVGGGGSFWFINGRERECLCVMNASNGSVPFLNIFHGNATCQLFSADTTPLRIDSDSSCSVILINLSLIGTESVSSIGGFWPFDGNAIDEQMGRNGTSVNNPTYVSPGITGRCCALQFNASANQSVQIDGTRRLNLSFRSFTFQLWIYPFSLTSNLYGDRGIIEQCQQLSLNLCLNMITSQ